MDGSQHKVLMVFTSNHARTAWEVIFRKPPRPTPLSRPFRFGDADKLRNLHRRFGKSRLSEDVQALEFAISQGHGIVELTLGDEQLEVLQRSEPSARS